MENEIKTLSTIKVSSSEDLYMLVDWLNRSLKKEELLFGLAKDNDEEGQMVFSIYRT
jgi:hypothetical protein